MKARTVLFICTANICRSPMAAALLRARLQKLLPDWKDWRVDSAGTWALDGEMAAKNSRLVMSERGLEISDHRARSITGEMIDQYNLILTMEAGQKEALKIEFPFAASRVYLFSEMIGSLAQVEDPYGQPIEKYRETAEKMDLLLEKGWDRILALAMEPRPEKSG